MFSYVVSACDFYAVKRNVEFMGFFDYFDLTKPCDACGNMVGGGVRWCPKCKICFCGNCYSSFVSNQVLEDLKNIHLHCPMCGTQFEFP